MRRVVGPVVLAAALVLSGCSGSDDGSAAQPTPVKPADDFTEGEIAPTSKTYGFGQPATVVGENGGQVKLTPVGVLYHKGPYTSGLTGPENGWYVAVAIRAEAVGKQDRPLSGAWRWRGGGQTIEDSDGNTGGSPWVGTVSEFEDPIEPGSPENGVISFDVPSKTDGRLLYIAEDQSIVSWTLPAADTGSGLDKVRARIKLFT